MKLVSCAFTPESLLCSVHLRHHAAQAVQRLSPEGRHVGQARPKTLHAGDPILCRCNQALHMRHPGRQVLHFCRHLR